MREFLRENPHFKVSIIITISAVVPMLFLALECIIRGEYLATAICGATAVILVATDAIVIGRKYKWYKRDKSREACFSAMNKYLDDLIDESKNNGLKVPNMSIEELEKFWYEVKNNRGYVCQKDSSFCGTLDCGKCVWSCRNSDKRYDYLKSIFEKEEGDKETMEENTTIEEFMRPGVLFKTKGGHWYINIRGNFAYHITSAVGGYIRIASVTSIKPEAIVEAYDNYATADVVDEKQPLFVSNIEAIINGRSFPWHIKTWKRPDPVKEMTMADLEKHFGCKVKIIKEI